MTGRGDAGAATWIFHGILATPRPQRGHTRWTRRRDRDPQIPRRRYTLSEDATVAEDHDGGLATITFAGKLVAKALLDATHLDAQLNPCLLKHICGAPLGLRDLQDLDWPLYSSLHQLAEIDVTDLCLTFAVESQNYGVVESRELVPGGADKAVTEENKHEFIALRLREGLFEGARANLNAFLRGVYFFAARSLSKDESRRRRGRDVDFPMETSRGDATRPTRASGTRSSPRSSSCWSRRATWR